MLVDLKILRLFFDPMNQQMVANLKRWKNYKFRTALKLVVVESIWDHFQGNKSTWGSGKSILMVLLLFEKLYYPNLKYFAVILSTQSFILQIFWVNKQLFK
jgi:hypothetical protein